MLLYDIHPGVKFASGFFQVIANMNASYKKEKKSTKRGSRSMQSITFKVGDTLYGSSDSAQLKRLKKSHFLSFPVETVLTSEQSGSDVK